MRSVQGARVCVVGGAGFLGSHLVEHLIEDRQCDVLVLDNLCVGRREFLHEDATFHHCDITKSESHLRNVFLEHGIQFVMNYAAHPYIPDSFVRPLHVFEVNATGAMNVINAAQEAGCEAILQVSSAEIYGEFTPANTIFKQGDKIDEDCEVRPHSTYGVAKMAVDAYCQTAWKERQTPVISLRQFNCLGERDILHPYIVPEIISQVAEDLKRVGKSMYPRKVKLGNNSFRDFIYAGDAVRIATELLEKGQFGEVYNLGSEEGIKMYDLAILVGKVMGTHVEVERDESRVRPWEIWHLLSDNSKIYSVVGARPQVTLERSLQKMVDWFRENEVV